MDRPPRAPTAKLLDAASLRFVAVSAAAKAVVGVAIIAAMPQLGSSRKPGARFSSTNPSCS
jgi:hypothetical protein